MNLTDEERNQLVVTLDCGPDELDDEIKKFTIAATEEYLRMILGQRVFTRGQDIREYRLYLLIREVYAGRLPTEQQISSLFQTTITQSRALLRSVISKYQYELQKSILRTLKEVLDPESCVEIPKTGGRRITVDSENVIEALNRQIIAIDGSLPQVTKLRNAACTYEIAESSYTRLREHLR